mgnify:CR=1 FL=1
MSQTYNVFYIDSTKAIEWITSGLCTADMISDQADVGNSHMQLDLDDFNLCENHYVNDAGNGVVEYSTFSPSVSAASIAIDATSTITNIPQGTVVKVEMSRETISTITMDSDESLTLTGTMAGLYNFTFTKDKYYQATTSITVEMQT